jgi:flagellar biosynthesis protein FliR
MSGILALLIAIWVCATVAVVITKDTECFSAALIATILIGVGYGFFRMIMMQG